MRGASLLPGRQVQMGGEGKYPLQLSYLIIPGGMGYACDQRERAQAQPG